MARNFFVGAKMETFRSFSASAPKNSFWANGHPVVTKEEMPLICFRKRLHILQFLYIFFVVLFFFFFFQFFYLVRNAFGKLLTVGILQNINPLICNNISCCLGSKTQMIVPLHVHHPDECYFEASHTEGLTNRHGPVAAHWFPGSIHFSVISQLATHFLYTTHCANRFFHYTKSGCKPKLACIQVIETIIMIYCTYVDIQRFKAKYLVMYKVQMHAVQ